MPVCASGTSHARHTLIRIGTSTRCRVNGPASCPGNPDSSLRDHGPLACRRVNGRRRVPATPISTKLGGHLRLSESFELTPSTSRYVSRFVYGALRNTGGCNCFSTPPSISTRHNSRTGQPIRLKFGRHLRLSVSFNSSPPPFLYVNPFSTGTFQPRIRISPSVAPSSSRFIRPLRRPHVTPSH